MKYNSKSWLPLTTIRPLLNKTPLENQLLMIMLHNITLLHNIIFWRKCKGYKSFQVNLHKYLHGEEITCQHES